MDSGQAGIMKSSLLLLVVFTLVALSGDSHAQEPASAPPAPAPGNAQDANQDADASLDNTIDAREDDAPPKRSLVHWNEYQGPYFTGRFGAGFLVDYSAFAQDEESKQQIAMNSDIRLRDFRFILGGKLFPKIKRSISWSAGIMYDSPNHQWLIRQTGVMIAVPELLGSVFHWSQQRGLLPQQSDDRL